MARIEVFVDGFNLYYGMREENATRTYRKTLWFDIMSFVRKYLVCHPDDTIENVYYFTAKPIDNNDKAERHETYCRALENSGVTIVYGSYKEKEIYCPNCKRTFKSHEEKETDVNIALYILRRGVENGYDKAVLFSGDSDLAPAIETAQKLFKDKRFQVLFPPNRNKSKRLKSVSNISPLYQYITCYKASQFPEEIILKDGNVVKRPESWK